MRRGRPILPRIRRSQVAGAFLDGVNAGALALMAVAAIQLGRAALVDLPTVGLGVAATVVLVLTRANSARLILLARLVGLACSVAVTKALQFGGLPENLGRDWFKCDANRG
jgi:chromate transport protein ChrA